MRTVYSYRESFQGSLFDFIHQSGSNSVPLHELTRELASQVAAYREEDKPLYPEIYLFPSREQQKALLGVGLPIRIGSVSLKATSAKVILKDCAPLAIGGWAIYVVPDTETDLAYGLMRAQRHSFAVNTDEDMLSLGPSNPVLLIRNRGHQTVEIQNTLGAKFVALFKSTQALEPELDAHVEMFTQAATATIPDPADFLPYLRRTLVKTLQSCHGTLMAVCPSGKGKLRKALTDAKQPQPCLNFHTLYQQAVKDGTAAALSDLQAAELLLKGMIDSDGVVVFRSDGAVIGFRSFLKPTAKEAKQIPTTGGGRRRTFELMKLRVPGTFDAVLFRSQDGETACHRKEQ